MASLPKLPDYIKTRKEINLEFHFPSLDNGGHYTILILIRKNKEREELHRAIRAIAAELRGTADGWDFKNYLLWRHVL